MIDDGPGVTRPLQVFGRRCVLDGVILGLLVFCIDFAFVFFLTYPIVTASSFPSYITQRRDLIRIRFLQV